MAVSRHGCISTQMGKLTWLYLRILGHSWIYNLCFSCRDPDYSTVAPYQPIYIIESYIRKNSQNNSILAAGTPTTPLLPLISRGATKPIPSSTTLTSGVLLLLLLCVLLLFYLFLFYFPRPALLTMIIIYWVFMFTNTPLLNFSLSLINFLTFNFLFFQS